MKVMSNTTAKRNQRVTAPLRCIQGQVPAIERFLVEDPDGNPTSYGGVSRHWRLNLLAEKSPLG
jgi:hypothetical protein